MKKTKDANFFKTVLFGNYGYLLWKLLNKTFFRTTSLPLITNIFSF